MKSLFWEFVHQVIIHPLLFFSRNATFLCRWHDYSKEKAWPKKLEYQSGYTMLVQKVKRQKRSDSDAEQ